MSLSAREMLELLTREHKLSTYRIAKESGLHQPTVYRVYKGENLNPRESTVAAIQRVFEQYATASRSPVFHVYEVTACTMETRIYRLPARSEEEALEKVREDEHLLSEVQSAVSQRMAPASMVRMMSNQGAMTITRVSSSAPSVSVPVPGQDQPLELSLDEARQLLSELADRLD